MRQILYNNANQVLRLEFPTEWDPSVMTGVTLTVEDRDSTELTAAASLTLLTDTTLAEDADRFASTIELDSGTDAVYPGDKLLIDGASGTEVVTVKGFDSTTKIVTLESILDFEHDSGDNVYGLFGTIVLDTSTVATYTAGLLLTLIWTPDSNQTVITEEAQIATAQMDIAGLEKSFSLVYPRAYKAFTEEVNRFADMAHEAETLVRTELMARNMDYNRIVDQDIVRPVLMAKMAWLWVLQGDEQQEDERAVIGAEYEKNFDLLCAQPVWTDDDQDLVEDDNETITHNHIFYSGW